jgi:DNA-binding transcriptional MerR regulator
MNRAKMTQLHRSANGDTWFFARDPATGLAFVRHRANTPSGGQVSDIEIGVFLNGPRHPEHEALLRLIGTLLLEAPGIDSGDELSVANTDREWLDEELFQLDDMLIRGISIEEIAQLLRRRRGEVQDKAVEIGRSCRMSGSAAGMSEPAKEQSSDSLPIQPPAAPEACASGNLLAELDAELREIGDEMAELRKRRAKVARERRRVLRERCNPPGEA